MGARGRYVFALSTIQDMLVPFVGQLMHRSKAVSAWYGIRMFSIHTKNATPLWGWGTVITFCWGAIIMGEEVTLPCSFETTTKKKVGNEL